MCFVVGDDDALRNFDFEFCDVDDDALIRFIDAFVVVDDTSVVVLLYWLPSA